jgi:hypothetical protein
MKRARHVVLVGVGRSLYRVLVVNLRERDHWGDPGVDGSIIIKWDVEVWTGLGWLRMETGGGHL